MAQFEPLPRRDWGNLGSARITGKPEVIAGWAFSDTVQKSAFRTFHEIGTDRNHRERMGQNGSRSLTSDEAS